MEKKHLIEPDPAIKESLMEAFDRMYPAGRKTSVVRFSHLANYPIPLYQATLAASLLILVMFFFLLQGRQPALTVAVADTVYIEKPEQPATSESRTVQSGAKDYRVKEYLGNQITEETARQNNGQPRPPLSENRLYVRQLDEALDRIPLILSQGRERSPEYDLDLLKLVAVVQ